MKKHFEMSIITHRKPDLLSRLYGFDDRRQLANSLPDDAFVIDLGSGNSQFGLAIASLRPDVTWINMDRRYGMNGVHKRRNSYAPNNLHYIAGDALNIPVQPQSVDRVYSCGLFPYLTMTDKQLAVDALHNIAGVLNDDGELAIAGFDSRAKKAIPDAAVHISSNEFQAAPDECAQLVLNAMTYNKAAQYMQAATNVVSHYLGLNALDRLTGH